MSTGRFSANEKVKAWVQSKVLPSLFHIAKLHEGLCHPTSSVSPSKFKTVIEWSQQQSPLTSENVYKRPTLTLDDLQTQSKRRCVNPVSASTTTQDSPGTPKHILQNAAHHYELITTIDAMKKVISSSHIELSTDRMSEALQTYISGLGVVCAPGLIPFWWPLEINHKEYTNLHKEGKR